MTREPTAIQNALDILNREKGELRAEIERLNGIEATGRKMWHEALAEIERLKEQLSYEASIAQLEIERLRREIGILKSLVAQYEKP